MRRNIVPTRRRSDAVLVDAPGGAQIPLAQLARVEHARGPAMISSENGLLVATVLLNVQGRDVGGFVEEARVAVAAQCVDAGRVLRGVERTMGEPGTRT